MFVLSKFAENCTLRLSLALILLVRQIFGSSETTLSDFVVSGQAKHVADNFIITYTYSIGNKTTV